MVMMMMMMKMIFLFLIIVKISVLSSFSFSHRSARSSSVAQGCFFFKFYFTNISILNWALGRRKFIIYIPMKNEMIFKINNLCEFNVILWSRKKSRDKKTHFFWQNLSTPNILMSFRKIWLFFFKLNKKSTF